MKISCFIALIVLFICSTQVAEADTAFVCNREFPIVSGADTLYQRFCGNVNLSTPNTAIRELHIYVHGTGLTSHYYTKNIIPAAKAAGKGRSIAIVAPQFIRSYGHTLPFADEYEVLSGGSLNLDTTHADNLYYGAGWIQGDRSFTGSGEGWSVRPFRISSFEVLDRILAKAWEIYPNINRMLITGHSAGGQMISRYVFFAQIPAGFPESNVIFAPVNPSSTLYFNGLRPDQPVGFPVTFSTPTDAQCVGQVAVAGPADPENFVGYNDYHYAMVDLNTDNVCDDCELHMAAMPFSTLMKNFRDRKIVRMISLDDNDPTEESMARLCMSHLQGEMRLARAEAFMQHVIEAVGYDKWVRSYDSLYVPGCAHDGPCVWLSTCGRYYLFGQNAGSCSEANKNVLYSSFDVDIAGWTKTGTGTFAHTTSRRAKGAGAAQFQGVMTDMIVTSPLLSIPGVHTVSWAGWVGSPMDSQDTVAVELSVDGGAWTEVGLFQGNQMAENVWHYQGTTVEAVTSIRIRFVGNATQPNEYVTIDEVRIMEREGLN